MREVYTHKVPMEDIGINVAIYHPLVPVYERSKSVLVVGSGSELRPCSNNLEQQYIVRAVIP